MSSVLRQASCERELIYETRSAPRSTLELHRSLQMINRFMKGFTIHLLGYKSTLQCAQPRHTLKRGLRLSELLAALLTRFVTCHLSDISNPFIRFMPAHPQQDSYLLLACRIRLNIRTMLPSAVNKASAILVTSTTGSTRTP